MCAEVAQTRPGVVSFSISASPQAVTLQVVSVHEATCQRGECVTAAPDDPRWPRASAWLEPAGPSVGPSTFALIGVPAASTSISPSRADTTPQAVREALQLYSTYATSRNVDISRLPAVDLGDVDDPSGPGGRERIIEALARMRDDHELVVVLGGDNSVTCPAFLGMFANRGATGDEESPRGLGACGLVTIDAHHDLRDGNSNGSPVRQLLDAGLPGRNIVQVGIADFSNSAEYAKRARDNGITVIGRSELRERRLADVVIRALEVAGSGGRPVYVDVDVDVCDRAAAPGCPSAAPGGISADELRQLVYLCARDSRVRALDITEVDASADSPDGRTVRLAALLVLEAAAGLASRRL